jgi:hypothetical protein
MRGQCGESSQHSRSVERIAHQRCLTRGTEPSEVNGPVETRPKSWEETPHERSVTTLYRSTDFVAAELSHPKRKVPSLKAVRGPDAGRGKDNRRLRWHSAAGEGITAPLRAGRTPYPPISPPRNHGAPGILRLGLLFVRPLFVRPRAGEAAYPSSFICSSTRRPSRP